MNKNSEKLVRKTSRATMNIYDYCEVRKVLKEQCVESNKIERQRKEM
jgi:hypothetical protein